MIGKLLFNNAILRNYLNNIYLGFKLNLWNLAG